MWSVMRWEPRLRGGRRRLCWVYVVWGIVFGGVGRVAGGWVVRERGEMEARGGRSVGGFGDGWWFVEGDGGFVG